MLTRAEIDPNLNCPKFADTKKFESLKSTRPLNQFRAKLNLCVWLADLDPSDTSIDELHNINERMKEGEIAAYGR